MSFSPFFGLFFWADGRRRGGGQTEGAAGRRPQPLLRLPDGADAGARAPPGAAVAGRTASRRRRRRGRLPRRRRRPRAAAL